MSDNIEWGKRLDELATELDRIERQTSADDIHVSTRRDRTDVTLVFENE